MKVIGYIFINSDQGVSQTIGSLFNGMNEVYK